MKKFTAIILVLMGVLLAGCAGEEQKAESAQKTLVMGTSADYKPFEYIDTANGREIIGFDIDIAKRVLDKMGYDLEIKNMDFNGLIAALNSNKVDFVMASMTPTEKRKKAVDFSDIYYVANDAIVSKKADNIKAVDDLEDKKLGIQLGSIQEETADELKKEVEGMQVTARDTIPQLIQEMKAGRIDAAIVETTVSKGYLEKNEGLTEFIIEDESEVQGAAAAFPKGSDLTEQYNKHLQEMKQNGEIDELAKKWFGGE